MAELFKGATLKRKDGSEVNADELKQKTVAIYFSAHWCPPCTMFTPVLKAFYEEANKEEFEIVFCSFDRSDEDAQKYIEDAHGNWLYMLPSNDKVEEISNRFGVEGIPALIVLNGSDAKLLTKEGRAGVESKKPAKETIAAWKK